MPRKSSKSAKQSKQARVERSTKTFLNFVAWITGIVVSLSIGFAMIGGTLRVPWWLGGTITSVIAGWVVVVATFVGVVVSIFSK